MKPYRIDQAIVILPFVVGWLIQDRFIFAINDYNLVG